MKSNIRLDHLNLSVNNFKQTAQWYKDVFGFQIVEHGFRDGKEWGIVKNGEYMLCIYEAPEKNQYEGSKYHQIDHFSIRIENQEEWELSLIHI